jgi:hypothetical protein
MYVCMHVILWIKCYNNFISIMNMVGVHVDEIDCRLISLMLLRLALLLVLCE